MTTTNYDLLLTGGTLLDPAQGINDRRDVAFRDGVVAAVEEFAKPGFSERNGNRQADRRPERVTPADPVPHRQAVLRRNAEPVRGVDIGGHRDALPLHRVRVTGALQ